MKSYFTLQNQPHSPLPAGFSGPDVRYADGLVEHFLRLFTQEGDTVFDPFAGFGTTLRVAEASGRAGYGVEFSHPRVEYAQARLSHPERLIHGDSRQLDRYSLPLFDLSVTSPPYMGRHDQEDPFTNYEALGGSYAQYLQDVRIIYRQVGRLMKPQARAVIEVANLRHADGVTTLAWDVAAAVGEALRFEGEMIALWEPTYDYGYDHSYCLVFQKP